MNQARETAHIYSNILDTTMDTYANIINNNMSSVMKTMTSFSIILMNIFVPRIESATTPKPLGYIKPVKEKKAKEDAANE